MADQVPLLDLRRQYEPLRQEILDAIARVCDRQRFILGAEVEALERELAEYLGVRHAVAVSSGTDALLVALTALGVGPGDEVVTTAFSFFATASTVARLGARPVFVDIDPVTFNIDPDALDAAITPRTKAIVPVHLFGLSADMDLIADSARRASVPIVEDAAQAIGATFKGRALGTLGAFGCFSFYPTKNLGAFGDAGLVVTGDDGRRDMLRSLRQHGMTAPYVHDSIGGNFRMDEIQAAVLRVKLPHLDGWSEARRRNAARYRSLFDAGGVADALVLPSEVPERRHIFNQFVVRTPRRDDLRAHLAARGVGSEIYYPRPLHLQPCFASLGHRQGDFPHAERAAAEVLALPVYPELTAHEQERVAGAIAEFVRTSVAASR